MTPEQILLAAKAKKAFTKALKEEFEVLKEMAEFEDERFNRNLEKVTRLTALQRREILRDALAYNAANIAVGGFATVPEQDFSNIVENYEEASKAIKELTKPEDI